ncbi:MAG: lytic murein transglycosylase [Alphaproteobacteria bacterium]|nr:lytic murein transglycosylase [Alphaproteobacteria bacterium]
MMSATCGLQLPTGFSMRLLIVVIVTSIFAPSAFSQSKPDFAVWLNHVKVEAAKRGIKQSIIDSALKDVQPIKRVLKRDRNQSEFKLTLKRYLGRVVTANNVKRGKLMAKRHQATLDAVARKYGVAPRVILAIWGIETRFGLVKANVPLIPSVATLAYDRRRSKYFRAQLFSVLEMLNRGYIDQKSLFGSWAGAMGQPQFMPSSYLAYAQDFDGDGRRDIWKSVPDVLASIANYLAKHRWRSDLTWGREVALPTSFAKNLGSPKRRAARGCRARTSEPKPLSQWQAAGVRRVNGQDLPTRDISAVLVLPDGHEGRAFLAYKNYASIMAYNCAHLYAITVGVLSDRIGGK